MVPIHIYHSAHRLGRVDFRREWPAQVRRWRPSSVQAKEDIDIWNRGFADGRRIRRTTS